MVAIKNYCTKTKACFIRRSFAVSNLIVCRLVCVEFVGPIIVNSSDFTRGTRKGKMGKKGIIELKNKRKWE